MGINLEIEKVYIMQSMLNDINQAREVLQGKIVNTSYYGELTTFHVVIEGIKNPVIVSSQRYDHKSFSSNNCYIGINLEDINLLTNE